MRWITIKIDNGPNFQHAKSSVIELVLTGRRDLSGSRPKSVANLPFVDFRYQPHCNYQSHWIRNFRFFFSYFGLFSYFERHFLKAIRIFQCFSSHNPKRFRQTTLDWEWWRLCRSFINLSEWRESSWLPISNTRGKISHFFTCVVTDFLRAGNPCIIP